MTDLRSIRLSSGAHKPDSAQMCAMEAVAYFAGEQHSDHPKCVCPVIATFMRSWNDGLPSDEERARVLGPRLFDVMGTNAGTEVAERRSWMAMDWLAREFTPIWLETVPTLASHATTLRGLAPITDKATCDAAIPHITAAASSAGDAARRWATGAARDCWAAAWDVAWASGRVRAAAEAAAAAAWAQARAAGADALQPTVLKLQVSAHDLLSRMIALTPNKAELAKGRTVEALAGIVGTV